MACPHTPCCPGLVSYCQAQCDGCSSCDANVGFLHSEIRTDGLQGLDVPGATEVLLKQWIIDWIP